MKYLSKDIKWGNRQNPGKPVKKVLREHILAGEDVFIDGDYYATAPDKTGFYTFSEYIDSVSGNHLYFGWHLEEEVK